MIGNSAPRAHRLVVGLDIGADRVRGVVTAPGGRVVEAEEWHTRPERGPDAVVDTVLGCAAELVGGARRSRARVTAVGVAVQGAVDDVSGVVERAATLGWWGTPLRTWLEEHLGLPVTVAGRSHAAAVAESRIGAGRGCERFALVSVGDDVEATEVLAGFPHDGEGAEPLGHVAVWRGWAECWCGSRCCPATAVPVPALVRRNADVPGGGGTAADVLRGTARGGRAAALARHEAVDALAEALVPLAARVDRLALGGDAAERAGIVLLGPLGAGLAARLPHRTAPELVTARLGARAASLGAALIAGEPRAAVGSAV
ncbi:ROK family protein [Streptomyces bobili]|uniref:ROK family protein n=1 Tax=Streptomyces bobili TaxID=67280 RepID=UPI0033E6D8E2